MVGRRAKVTGVHVTPFLPVVANSARVVLPILRHRRIEALGTHGGQHWLRRADEHLAKSVRIDGAAIDSPDLALPWPDLPVAVELIARGAPAGAFELDAPIGAHKLGERVCVVRPDG